TPASHIVVQYCYDRLCRLFLHHKREVVTRRGADGNRGGTSTSGQGKDLSGILRRTEQISTLYGDQSQVATNGDRSGPAGHLCLPPNDRAAYRRTKGVAYAHGNIAR